MTTPIALPRAVKAAARVLRDWPVSNAPATMVVRAALPFLPARSCDWLTSHFPRVGGVSARLPSGKRIRLVTRAPETVTNAVFYHGWDAGDPDLRLWHRLAERSGLILDIGAHVGHFAIVGALANPAARILAFEPMPAIAEALRRNVRRSRCDHIEVHQCAVASAPGTATFYASQTVDLPSSSSLSRSFMASSGAALRHIEVAVTTLDALALPAPAGGTLLKLDTETTEADVILGAGELLRTHRPVLIVEVLEQENAAQRLTAALDAVGYRHTPYLLTAAGPSRRDSIVADPVCRNFVLVPPGSALAPIVAAFADRTASA